MFKELVKKNRSYRRFYQEKEITKEELYDLLDTARYTASGANKQPLRYIVSNEREKNERIFSCLRWAGYLQDWDGPEEGEKPAAYIVILSPKEINASHDEGIVAQTILLSAVEKGYGGCMIGNIDREKLSKNLKIPEEYAIKLVIALGCPKENIIIEEISAGDDIKYYRDKEKIHHVPKIKLEDLIL